MKTVSDRFHEKYEINPDTGCWEWNAATTKWNYGQMRVGKGTQLAHRVSWKLHHGEIPEGLVVMHSVCDNTRCVNPQHLALGTVADNNLECIAKGRHVSLRGEAHASSKINQSIANEIRQLYATGQYSQQRLGSLFGISRSLVGNVVTGLCWT